MTQQPDYLHYLASAKRAETAEMLRSQGFSVESEFRVGDTEFDLVAEKGAQKLAYEFKAGRSARTSRDSLRKLQEVAAEQGWQFRIVVVTPPPRVHIEVETLQPHLKKYAMEHHFDELDQLSAHTRVLGVNDLEIADLRMKNDEVRVSGRGSIDVELQYEGGSDPGTFEDSYPFHFAATLKPTGELIEVEKLNVDTSSFYE